MLKELSEEWHMDWLDPLRREMPSSNSESDSLLSLRYGCLVVDVLVFTDCARSNLVGRDGSGGEFGTPPVERERTEPFVINQKNVLLSRSMTLLVQYNTKQEDTEPLDDERMVPLEEGRELLAATGEPKEVGVVDRCTLVVETDLPYGAEPRLLVSPEVVEYV